MNAAKDKKENYIWSEKMCVWMSFPNLSSENAEIMRV